MKPLEMESCCMESYTTAAKGEESSLFAEVKAFHVALEIAEWEKWPVFCLYTNSWMMANALWLWLQQWKKTNWQHRDKPIWAAALGQGIAAQVENNSECKSCRCTCTQKSCHWRTPEHSGTQFMFFCGHERAESAHKCDPGSTSALYWCKGSASSAVRLKCRGNNYRWAFGHSSSDFRVNGHYNGHYKMAQDSIFLWTQYMDKPSWDNYFSCVVANAESVKSTWVSWEGLWNKKLSLRSVYTSKWFHCHMKNCSTLWLKAFSLVARQYGFQQNIYFTGAVFIGYHQGKMFRVQSLLMKILILCQGRNVSQTHEQINFCI